MYAARKVYVKQWDFQNPDERYTVQIAYGGKPVPGIQADRIRFIDEEVMYWRKANHIHQWFVTNVQNGNDDCEEYYVDWEKLRELLSVCKEVLEHSKLVEGMVYVGTQWKPGMTEPEHLREPGKIIEDPTTAKNLLPRQHGFFFGSEEYDQFYLEDVQQTYDWAALMLADHDRGVPGDIYYSSSW